MKRLLALSYSLVALVFLLPLVLMWLSPLALADEHNVEPSAESAGAQVTTLEALDLPPAAGVDEASTFGTPPPDDKMLVLAPVPQPSEQPETFTSDSEVTVRVVTSEGVKSMLLSDYLPCVVMAEMPPSFSAEALKAQAVAARTFVYYQMLGTGKHSNGDICTNPACCMAYKACTSDAIFDAVSDTDGQVMLYDDQPILAAFHASAGGKTRAAQSVWGGSVSYLVAVDSPDSDIGKNGHGVGMSQHGARAFAENGAAYDEILEHYYVGAQLGGCIFG